MTDQMSTGSVVVTGVAHHSLGEAVVNACLRRMPMRIIGIDQTSNPTLQRNPNFRHLAFDLNPLSCSGGIEEFASSFKAVLSNSLVTTGAKGVAYLVQSAGVYDFGAFLDYDARRRKRVLGLNVLGSTEVLHAVMTLNTLFQRRNDEAFVHIFIGSFQGLYARAGRSLYGPSKAFGIDLCASLSASAEIARCIYVAPGPIDTPMLHRNHWVTKAGGSELFFDRALHGPADTYESIFVYCEEAALEKVAHREGESSRQLKDVLARYRNERRNALEGKMGVLSRQACAATVVDTLMLSDSSSGVYVLRTDDRGAGIVCEAAAFSNLDRKRVFSSDGQGQ